MDVDALLARMTVDEKLAQLGCVWSSALIRDERFSPAAAARWLGNGMGEITRIGATTGLQPRARAEFANEIQRWLVEHTRLGIPAVVHEESTAGLCARDATQFPQAIGLASTWDPQLIERIGVVIREQMVTTGARHTLAPVLATQRNFNAPIPLSFGMACNEWFAQALTLGAGKQKLSNGLELDTGL